MDSVAESSFWKRYLMRLDAFAIAVDYDPMEEMQARMAHLERELAKLRAETASDRDRVERIR